jgi:hypothetical protein
MSIYTDCTVIGDHDILPCAPIFGGVSSLAYLLKGHGITDYSSEAQWLVAIAAGKAKVVTDNVMAEQPTISPVTSSNIDACGPADLMVGSDATINIMDFNVNATNVDFYAALARQKKGALVLNLCGEEGTMRIYEDVQFRSSGSANLPLTNRDKQQFDVQVLLYKNVGQRIYETAETPDNIFDSEL